jgi:hypothetical protein
MERRRGGLAGVLTGTAGRTLSRTISRFLPKALRRCRRSLGCSRASEIKLVLNFKMLSFLKHGLAKLIIKEIIPTQG